MRSSRTQLLAAALVLLVLLAAYVFWYEKVEGESANVAALSSKLALDEAASASIAQSKNELATLSGEEQEVSSYFVSSAGVVPFLQALQALASGVGATAQVLSVAAGGTNANPTLELSLSLTGTFAQVASAAGAIEYAPYDLSVSSLSFAGTGAGAWQAQMTIVVGALSVLPQGSAATPGTATPIAPALGGSPQTQPL